MKLSRGLATRFRRTLVLGGSAPQAPRREEAKTQHLNCPLNRGRSISLDPGNPAPATFPLSRWGIGWEMGEGDRG